MAEELPAVETINIPVSTGWGLNVGFFSEQASTATFDAFLFSRRLFYKFSIGSID